MPTQIILIIGLPASGKSTLARRLKKKSDVILDDPNHYWDIYSYGIRTKGTLYITDPRLCIPRFLFSARKEIEKIFPFVGIEIIKIPNDKEKAIRQAKSRGDYQRVKSSIESFSKLYRG